MKKLRNCPFCNAEVDANDPVYGVHFNKLIGKWLFGHSCHHALPVEVDITVYGETEEEVVNRWNGEVKESESL